MNTEITSLTPDEFYSQLSTRYDQMTRDQSRWKGISDIYKNIFNDKDIKRVLDAGCGSGGEAIALARSGYKVIGIDITPELIEVAKSKAADYNLDIKFFVTDLKSIDITSSELFDAIICRGNTLPHILTTEELKTVFAGFNHVSRPGSMLILQWLNYNRILNSRKRLVGVSEHDDMKFIRFYDFMSEEELHFNILTLSSQDGLHLDWQTTKLRPWLPDDVGMLLRQTGWENLKIAADLRLAEFDALGSNDVVMTAVRSDD